MLKFIEVLAESTKSWEDAALQAVAHASNSVGQVTSLHIDSFDAIAEGGRIKEYRVNAKISFIAE